MPEPQPCNVRAIQSFLGPMGAILHFADGLKKVSSHKTWNTKKLLPFLDHFALKTLGNQGVDGNCLPQIGAHHLISPARLIPTVHPPDKFNNAGSPTKHSYII